MGYIQVSSELEVVASVHILRCLQLKDNFSLNKEIDAIPRVPDSEFANVFDFIGLQFLLERIRVLVLSRKSSELIVRLKAKTDDHVGKFGI
jgi:hypothetical protein